MLFSVFPRILVRAPLSALQAGGGGGHAVRRSSRVSTLTTGERIDPGAGAEDVFTTAHSHGDETVPAGRFASGLRGNSRAEIERRFFDAVYRGEHRPRRGSRRHVHHFRRAARQR